MKFAVFDSGIGGEAVAADLGRAFPDAEIVTINDRSHLPYGDKTPAQIIRYTDSAIQPLLVGNVDVIIIACNTATTLALPTLRRRYPNQKFIGIEPMVKPAAALTKSKTICVCATPATLASARYNQLLSKYADKINVIQPDCAAWTSMIEQNHVDKALIQNQIMSALDDGADVIVLGCTHYHWIKKLIKQTAKGRITVLEPTSAIARRIKNLLLL